MTGITAITTTKTCDGKDRAATKDEWSMIIMVARREEIAAGSDELELK